MGLCQFFKLLHFVCRLDGYDEAERLNVQNIFVFMRQSVIGTGAVMTMRLLWAARLPTGARSRIIYQVAAGAA